MQISNALTGRKKVQIEQADAALGRLYTALRDVMPAGATTWRRG